MIVSGAMRGIFALVGSATIWGLSPLFYAQLRHVPPEVILGHRAIWSLLLFAVILGLQGRLGEVARAVKPGRGLVVHILATLMIAANWYGFIWAVGQNRTSEASLGYYIFPLVAVLIGQVAFAEPLARLQWAAVGIALVAVTVLGFGLGSPPWIALILATTFGIYGLLKKRLDVRPVASVTAEVLIFTPVAIAILWQAGGGPTAPGTLALLALSGPMTAVPLILFSYASRRVRMATVGLVQYLNPTLQVLSAVLILSEPLTVWHAIAFPLIWVALALYTVAAWRADAAARRVAASSAPVVTTE